jgi:hypothetical protein
MVNNLNSKKAVEMTMNSLIGVVIGVVSIILLFALLGKFGNFFPQQNVELNAPEIISVEAYPDSGEIGTTFIVQALADKTDIFKSVRASIGGQSFNLYDSGKNGDKISGDGVYSGIFDSSKIKTASVLSGKVFARGNKNYAGSFSVELVDNSCKNLLQNGNPKDKIDVLVIPVDYSSIVDFEKDLERYVDLNSENKGLFFYSPLKENKLKFNVNYLNKLYSKEDLNCEIGCKGVASAVCCSDKIVSRVAASCSSDHIILLLNHNSFCGSASSYAKICAYDGSNEKVMVHEFGHTFGGLGDEYNYEMYPGMKKINNYNFPNCALDCKTWPASVEAGCFAGCGYSEYFRSADTNSIMYTYVDVFNPVSKYYLQQKLDKYSDVVENEPLENKSKQYLTELEYHNGTLLLDRVYSVPAMPSERKNVDGEYSVNLISFNKKTLFSSKFDIIDFILPFYEENSSNLSSIIFEDEINYTLSMPYYDNAQRMEIFNKSGKILEVDVSQLANTCGNNFCEDYENYDSCPSDCGIQLDSSCSPENDGICDKDCLKGLDSDCSSSRGIYLLILALLGLVIFILVVLRLQKKH